MSTSQDNLQEAAMIFGKADADLAGGLSCRVPVSMLDYLAKNKVDAELNLRISALQYFHDVYDGATE
jgi:hypothetical protein